MWISTPDCDSSAQCISECKSCPSTGEKPNCGNSKLVAGVICSKILHAYTIVYVILAFPNG